MEDTNCDLQLLTEPAGKGRKGETYLVMTLKGCGYFFTVTNNIRVEESKVLSWDTVHNYFMRVSPVFALKITYYG